MNVSSENPRTKVLNRAFNDVKGTLENRHPGYREEPTMYMPVETLLHQIRLKSERSIQATNIDKQIDEVRDTMAYSAFVLGRLLEEKDRQEEMKCVAADSIN